MLIRLFFEFGVACKADTELIENLVVDSTEHHGGVYLTSKKLGELFERTAALLVVSAQQRQGNEYLVGMQAGIATAEVSGLGMLNRLYHVLRNQLDRVVDSGKILGGVEDKSRTRAEEFGAFGGDDSSVLKLDCRAVVAACSGALACGGDWTTVNSRLNFGLIEKQTDFIHLRLIGVAQSEFIEGREVTADDFVVGRNTADLVVADAEAYHVHTHIGRRFIGILAVDAFEEGVEDGEDFDVAVIVDSGLAVRLKVEGVNHIDVIEVGSGGLIGDVDGVLQGEAPDGECLEFGITGTYAAAVLVVELAETHGHFAAAGTGGSDNDKRTCRGDIVVSAEAFVAVNQLDVVGVTVNEIVYIGRDIHTAQALAESVGTALAVVMRDNDRADHKATVDELAAEAEHVFVVGNAEVVADFVFLNIDSADNYHDFGPVAELAEHFQLAVGLKTGQNAACMIIVEELAAKLEIQFVAEPGDALLDVFGLDFEIFLVIETVFHNGIQNYIIFPIKRGFPVRFCKISERKGI